MNEKIVYLKSVNEHAYSDVLKERVPIALEYFPELDVVYVGIIRKDSNNKGNAMPENSLINFRVNLIPSFVTIFHELMHIVAFKNNLPKTEEFCSVYAMARMPFGLVDYSIPYIGGDVDKEKQAEVCREAVKYREKGHKNYLEYVRKRVFKKEASK